MTTTVPAPTTPLTTSAAPGSAVTRLAVRQVRRGAAVVTVVAAAMSAVVVATYDSLIATAPGGAGALAALAGNPAIRTLFGEPVALDSAGGFTVWRTGTALAVLIGVWSALTAVRVLRGEEDTGRWELLMGGRVPVAAVVARHLAVIACAALAAGAAVTVALLATGTTTAGAVTHGLSLALIGVFAAGVGGVAAQLLPTRAAAAGAAVGVIVAGLLARMVGDGVGALEWLRWLSPFGLAALTGPFHEDRALPLLVLACAAGVLLAIAVTAAARRDIGSGILAPARARPSSTRLLGSVTAFAVRRAGAPLIGWALGIAAFYLLIGLISTSLTSFLADNPQFADLARQGGFELDSVQGYAATLFALLAVPLGGFVAVRIVALARAETARRLDLLLATPTTRLRLLGAEAGVTAAAAVVLSVVAAVATWLGTAVVGASLGLGAALAGTLNTLPVTALGLGAALLAMGWAPGAVLAVGLLPGAGGFLLTVLVDSIDAPAWLAAVSPFAHVGLVPAAAPDVAGTVGMTVLAVVIGSVGLLGYHRRDIRTG